MRRSRRNILLTGFGPFPGVPDNLTARLIPQLAAQAERRFRGHTVVAATLPTEWSAAPRLLADLYDRHQPKLALHFGVSDRATGFTIETLAVNRCLPRLDAAGCMPVSELIDNAGIRTAPTQLPAARILARLHALGIPASLSDDAGSYLCNTVFYRALQHARAGSAERAMSGFIHIPATLADDQTIRGGTEAFTWPVALRGSLEIIRVCLGLPQISAGSGTTAGSA